MLHNSVLSTKYTLKQRIQAIEVDYYNKHGQFPTQEQQQYSTLCKQLDYIRKLSKVCHTFDII